MMNESMHLRPWIGPPPSFVSTHHPHHLLYLSSQSLSQTCIQCSFSQEYPFGEPRHLLSCELCDVSLCTFCHSREVDEFSKRQMDRSQEIDVCAFPTVVKEIILGYLLDDYLVICPPIPLITIVPCHLLYFRYKRTLTTYCVSKFPRHFSEWIFPLLNLLSSLIAIVLGSLEDGIGNHSCSMGHWLQVYGSLDLLATLCYILRKRHGLYFTMMLSFDVILVWWMALGAVAVFYVKENCHYSSMNRKLTFVICYGGFAAFTIGLLLYLTRDLCPSFRREV